MLKIVFPKKYLFIEFFSHHFIGGIVTNFFGKILEIFITKFRRLGEQVAFCIITLPIMAIQTSNQKLSL